MKISSIKILKRKTKTWEQWQRPPAVPSGLPSLHTPEHLDEQELHTLERSWWWCSCCTACPPAPWRGDGPRPASTLAFEPCARPSTEQRRFLQIKKQKKVKGYHPCTLKGAVFCFYNKPGTLLRKFEKPISLWATDPDLKHTWFRGQREAFFNLDMRMRISHIQSRTSSWNEKFWHLISGFKTRLRTKFFNLRHPDEIEIYYLVSQTTRPQRELRSRRFSWEFFENLICCFHLDWYFLQKRLLLSWFFLKWYIFFHW